MLPRKTVQLETMRWVRRIMFVTALVGLFASIYLLITYTSGKPIVCGTTHGCEVVRASAYAYMGPIPRPALGVLFYAGFLFWLILRLAFAKPSWQKVLLELTWIGACIGFLESAWLFYIQAVIIKSFCTWCLTSGATATILFFLSFFDSADTLEERIVTKEIKWIFNSVLVFIIVGGILLWGLIFRTAGGELPGIKQDGMNVPVGDIFPAGTPFEGPATATVRVVEFIDFECPACGAYHPIMKQIREEFAGKIQFAQRQLPLIEVHKHAHDASKAAVCAMQQNRYFEMADALIVNRENLTIPDLEHYASALRLDTSAFTTCLQDPKTTAYVDEQRAAAIKLGIDQTPTIFINDLALEDLPSLEQFRTILNQKLQK